MSNNIINKVKHVEVGCVVVWYGLTQWICIKEEQ